MNTYIQTDRQTEIRTHIRTYLLTYLTTYIHACVHTYIHYITLTTLLHYINYITLHYMTDIITVDDRHSYSVHSCTHTYVYIYILAYIPTYLPTDRPTYLPTYWGELGQPAKNAIFAGFTIPAPMCCSSGNSELHFFHTGAPYADRMGLKKSPKAKAMIPKLKYLRRFWVLRAMVMRSHWTYIYTYIHAYIHTCLHAYRHAYMFL